VKEGGEKYIFIERERAKEKEKGGHGSMFLYNFANPFSWNPEVFSTRR
jgi:hypothetical protein